MIRHLLTGLCILGCFWLISCADQEGTDPHPATVWEGRTMGTYYRITSADPASASLQGRIDSLLVAINLEVSTYIDTSTISRFNQAEEMFCPPGQCPSFLDELASEQDYS